MMIAVLPPNARLRLRPLQPADLSFVRRLAQDERVVRYVGNGMPWTNAYVRKRFDEALNPTREGSDTDVRWYIAEGANDDQIGLLALTARPNETEIGYWILPDVWGQGHAGELIGHARLLTREHLPLTAIVHRHNVASIRALERNGFGKWNIGRSAPTDLVRYRFPAAG